MHFKHDWYLGTFILGCTTGDMWLSKRLNPDSKKKIKTKPQVPSKGIKMGTLKLWPFLETKAIVYVFSLQVMREHGNQVSEQSNADLQKISGHF